jgi:hypothetical protein
MSYGTPEWQRWVLGEEEGIAQIKFACVIIIFKAEAPCAPLLISISIPPPVRSNSAQLRERHSNL